MDPKISATLNRKTEKEGFDNFPTPPKATRAFFEYVYEIPKGSVVWDCAAGQGHMCKVFKEYGYEYFASDIHIYNNRIPEVEIQQMDIFNSPNEYRHKFDWIITNPPFNKSREFVLHTLNLAKYGVAILVRLLWLEGEMRYNTIFKDRRPNKVALFSKRVGFAEGKVVDHVNSGVCFAWFVFDKSKMEGEYDCVLDWIPPRISHLIKDGDFDSHGEYVSPMAQTQQLTLKGTEEWK